MMQPISVVITDDNVSRRARLGHTLNSTPNINVIADTDTLEQAQQHTATENARILLINVTHAQDLALPAFHQRYPDIQVILLTDETLEQEELIMQALAKGARGYFSFESDTEMIAKAIKAIHQGEAWISRKMLGKIMEQKLLASQRN